MTDEQAEIRELHNKIDALTNKLNGALQILETLGDLIVFRKVEADEMLGLNKQTLSKSTSAETFDEVGSRRVYVNLKSVAVYNTKKRKKR